MRRQDLLTALVRNPDHTVFADGRMVVGLEVRSSTIELQVAHRAQSPDAEKRAQAEAVERAFAEGRSTAEAEIANMRETFEQEKAAAVAAALEVERAGHERAIAAAVESALARANDGGDGA